MKKQYIPPIIEVYTYQAEKGFAWSVHVSEPDLSMYEPLTENRTESENWTVDNDEGFWTSSW